MATSTPRPMTLAGSPAPAAGPDAAPAAANAVQVKILTIIVIVLGVLLLVGLATVVGRIIYLGSQRAPVPQSSTLPSTLSVPVPAGASIKHTAITGDRLAITYEAPERKGIIVINVPTGQIVSRIELVTEVPR